MRSHTHAFDTHTMASFYCYVLVEVMLVIVPSSKVFQHCEFYFLVKTNVGIRVLNRTSTHRNFHSCFDLYESHYTGEGNDVSTI